LEEKRGKERSMATEVRLATLDDLKYVEHLSRIESFSIGFVPKPAYEAAITGLKAGKRWSPVCNDRLFVATDNDDYVGFVLASFGDKARVTQIAIQEDARLLERGALLLEAVTDEGARRQCEITHAGCAADLPSNSFWEAMGFRNVGVRKGIHFESKLSSNRDVNLWQRTKHQLWLPFDTPATGTQSLGAARANPPTRRHP
jgi:GNAT superfamily N-acetyltransferase